MRESEIIRALDDAGLVVDGVRSGRSFDETVRVFQEIHGLAVDGAVGPVTERQLTRPRFCAVPDRLVLNASEKCRWDHTRWNGREWVGEPAAMLLSYHVAEALPGLSRAATEAAFAEALGYWAAVCAVTFTPTASPRAANLLFEIGAIDGPSGTLAYQFLPCGRDTSATQLRGKYGSAEPWVASADPSPSRIDAVRVICHEVGHGLGLDHGPEGALLAPYYDRTIRRPRAWDIAEAQLRYGAPLAAPAPPPTSDSAHVTIVLPDGTNYSGTLEASA